MNNNNNNNNKDINESKLKLVKTKTVIDMNTIGQDSLLTGHYLFETTDNRRRFHPSFKKLGDLKLSEVWPQSNMCKLSRKANPWVRAQQEKSVANELNTFFRISRERSTSPPQLCANQFNNNQSNGVRTGNTPYFCLLPSFKYTS